MTPAEIIPISTPAARAAKPRVCWIPYCNLPHRLQDGKPIAHCCHVIPSEALAAAIAGDYARAVAILARDAAAGPLKQHGGIWTVRRR